MVLQRLFRYHHSRRSSMSSSKTKSPTRRQSQRPTLARLVQSHESRQRGSWLIFDVRQKADDHTSRKSIICSTLRRHRAVVRCRCGCDLRSESGQGNLLRSEGCGAVRWRARPRGAQSSRVLVRGRRSGGIWRRIRRPRTMIARAVLAEALDRCHQSRTRR